MAEKFKVTVDREDCISCGVCWSTCPDVFEESAEDGLTQITEQYWVGGDLAEGIVPGDLEECIKDSADSCPVEVIHVSED